MTLSRLNAHTNYIVVPFVLLLILTLSLTCINENRNEEVGQLNIILLDSATGKSVSANVYIKDTNGSAYLVKNCLSFDVLWMKDRITHSGRHFNTINNFFSIELKEGKYKN